MVVDVMVPSAHCFAARQLPGRLPYLQGHEGLSRVAGFEISRQLVLLPAVIAFSSGAF